MLRRPKISLHRYREIKIELEALPIGGEHLAEFADYRVITRHIAPDVWEVELHRVTMWPENDPFGKGFYAVAGKETYDNPYACHGVIGAL